ncbi:hypothetical protein [Nocardia macrotermitis]|uniref:Uncharacterized protein n=1 Tax=Nocardia macrotermitis TaxID=2585198 RepID=A0A7K0D1W6_9NOCA|nr:hypothetical protein [Nocardia macrotermitis]MQY19720.1 hypothetical protein [Nocardia macrotermitis]
MTASGTDASKRPAPLTIDPATDEIRRGMVESTTVLDGSLTASVAMLTGLSPERIEELGGVGDWA